MDSIQSVPVFQSLRFLSLVRFCRPLHIFLPQEERFSVYSVRQDYRTCQLLDHVPEENNKTAMTAITLCYSSACFDQTEESTCKQWMY